MAGWLVTDAKKQLHLVAARMPPTLMQLAA
eukprot:COSAG01_NODE_64544_length_276_cov_0.587571_1_plen_29_part_01